MAVDEQAWWRANPDPQVIQTTDRLTLWNYPVGKTQLVEAHAAALRSFLGAFFLAPELTGSRISIVGHASSSGEAELNESIAEDRAQNVAQYLVGLRFKGLEVSSAGSSQPAAPSLTGQGMARNRRVEVTMAGLKEPIAPRVSVPDDTSPSPAAPSGGGSNTAVGATFEYEFDLPSVPFSTPTTETTFTMTVKGRGRVVQGSAKFAEGISIKGSSIQAKFEAKLGDHLKAKFGVDPGGGDKAPKVKAGWAGEAWGFPIEQGFQTSPQFFYTKITLIDQTLPKLDLDDGTVVSLDFSLEIKIEIGPSKALLARIATPVAEAVGTTGAVAVGVIGVTAVIIGGIIYATEDSKAKMLAVVNDLATRDGAASQIAYEALEGTSGVATAVAGRRLELTKAGGQQSREGFETGRKVVTDYLSSLKDQRDAKIKAWADSLAANSNETDFDVVRERILQKLDPYEDSPPDLASLVAGL